MPPNPPLTKQYQAIVDANAKLVAAQERGLAGDYAALLRNLKYIISNAYESYAQAGALTYTEMQRFNRIRALNGQVTAAVDAGMVPSAKRIRNTLEAVVDGTYTGSIGAISRAANVAVEQSLSAARINELVTAPVFGLTPEEREALRVTDIGNRIKQTLSRAMIQEEPYETTAGMIRDDVTKSYIKSKSALESQAHMKESAAFAESFKDAAESDIEVTKTWVTAGDDRVRDSHAAMDGQTVGAQEMFRITDGPNAGAEADGPGLFGIPEEDINCRCWVVAGVRRKE